MDATRPAIQRAGKAREVLVGPCGRDSKAGMDEQNMNAREAWKGIEGLDLFTAADAHGGTILEKEIQRRNPMRRLVDELFDG